MKTLEARIVLTIIGGITSFVLLYLLYRFIGWEFDPLSTIVVLTVVVIMELAFFHTYYGSYVIWVPLDKIDELESCMHDIGFERDENEMDKTFFVKNPHHFFKKRVFVFREDGQFYKGIIYNKIKDNFNSIKGVIFIGS